MSFYPSEKSKGLNGLNDTSIVTPVDNDAPVYNSTTQKWENKQITTKEQWKKNGAYNLACGVFTSKVENGSTWIANPNGSVSVSGEATGSNITSSPFILKAGTYLVGFNPIPQSGGVTTDSTNFTILDSSNNHLTGLPLNDATSKVITVAADTVVKIRLYAYANSSGHTTNTTFYPLITTDLNATVADFVSPAKTNQQLTEDTTGHEGISDYITPVTSGNSIETNNMVVDALGKLRIVHVTVKFSADVNSSVKVATAKAGSMPRSLIGFSTTTAGIAKSGYINTSGEIYVDYPRAGWTYGTLVYVAQ